MTWTEAWDTMVGSLTILLSPRVGRHLLIGEMLAPALDRGYSMTPPEHDSEEDEAR